MLAAKPLPILFGAALLAVVGALLSSPWASAAGCLGVLGVLAIHPAVIDSTVPRATRLLLWAGLLLIALAVFSRVWVWVALRLDVTADTSELIAQVTDPVRRRRQFLGQLGVAVCLVAACACFGAAIGRLPRDRLRSFGRAVLAVGGLTLVTVVLAALSPSGLEAPLGSITDVALAVVLVLGGYAWVMGRAVRQHRAAASAAVGAVLLAGVAWLAADDAWSDLPQTRDGEPFLQAGVAMSVAVSTGPDIETAVTVAVVLLATALTVLSCAKLSRAGGQAP